MISVCLTTGPYSWLKNDIMIKFLSLLCSRFGWFVSWLIGFVVLLLFLFTLTSIVALRLSIPTPHLQYLRVPFFTTSEYVLSFEVLHV